MRRMCTLLSRKPVAWLWDSFATPWYKNWVKRDSKPSSSSVPVNWNRACLVNHSGAFPEDISASGSEIHTFTLWKPTEWITTTAPFKLLVGFNRRNMLVVLDHQPKQRGNKQDTWDQSLVGLIPRRAEPPAAGGRFASVYSGSPKSGCMKVSGLVVLFVSDSPITMFSVSVLG